VEGSKLLKAKRAQPVSLRPGPNCINIKSNDREVCNTGMKPLLIEEHPGVRRLFLNPD
jgi:hypothetical protein